MNFKKVYTSTKQRLMLSDKEFFHPSDKMTRRKFIAASSAVLGAASFTLVPFRHVVAKPAGESLTIQQVIDLIIKDIPNAPYKQTVDTLKSGSADTVVSGIVTTMFPTVNVIRQAAALKANFIIVHEPSFYNHADEVAWLSQDDVYNFKRELLEKNNIAVWRCHDYLHSRQLDGVQHGVFNAMGWSQYYNADNPRVVNLPPIKLSQLIQQLKTNLEVKTIRFIGDLEQSCQRIVMSPGAPDGKLQIKAIHEEQPDVFICGELREWETAEYVRDARSAGKNLSLIVLGHSISEEPGMEWLKNWLQPKVGNIKVTHVPSQNAFSWM